MRVRKKLKSARFLSFGPLLGLFIVIKLSENFTLSLISFYGIKSLRPDTDFPCYPTLWNILPNTSNTLNLKMHYLLTAYITHHRTLPNYIEEECCCIGWHEFYPLAKSFSRRSVLCAVVTVSPLVQVCGEPTTVKNSPPQFYSQFYSPISDFKISHTSISMSSYFVHRFFKNYITQIWALWFLKKADNDPEIFSKGTTIEKMLFTNNLLKILIKIRCIEIIFKKVSIRPGLTFLIWSPGSICSFDDVTKAQNYESLKIKMSKL